MRKFIPRSASYAAVLLIYALCFSCWCTAQRTVLTYDYNNFPKQAIALHMPCEESNMFATKCMCHIKCKGSSCDNAKAICEKYIDSKGCRYMLVRNVGRYKIATLKRRPTAEELQRFNISMYPKDRSEIDAASSKWQKLARRNKKATGPTLRSIVDTAGVAGTEVLQKLFHRNITGVHCGPEKYYTQSAAYKAKKQQLKIEEQTFLDRSIALVVLSYHAPKTLTNTLRSWMDNGLLSLVSERIAILNDPMAQELAVALDHGFNVVEPRDIGPDVKMSKPNVLTIGAAFYYALKHVKSEYVLFMENDFKIDLQLPPVEIQKQLIASAGLLEGGMELIRLMSRKYQGCGTFKTCDHHGIHLDSPLPSERRRNWYAFYCRDRSGTESLVSDCIYDPGFRCFTSWDTNWSLNAVMVKKSTMLNKKYPKGRGGASTTIAEVGLSQAKKQDGFESVMVNGAVPWQKWRVPLCIAYQGMFLHEEIETST